VNKYLPLQELPKFTHSGIFGLKINHLATLLATLVLSLVLAVTWRLSLTAA
jgi:hypothetical protein